MFEINMGIMILWILHILFVYAGEPHKVFNHFAASIRENPLKSFLSVITNIVSLLFITVFIALNLEYGFVMFILFFGYFVFSFPKDLDLRFPPDRIKY